MFNILTMMMNSWPDVFGDQTYQSKHFMCVQFVLFHLFLNKAVNQHYSHQKHLATYWGGGAGKSAQITQQKLRTGGSY